MSRTLFFKAFKAATGQTPNEFIDSYRVSVAKKLIQENDYSIAEIAEMAGFYDSSHFIKTFKKYCGITPLQMRKGKVKR